MKPVSWFAPLSLLLISCSPASPGGGGAESGTPAAANPGIAPQGLPDMGFPTFVARIDVGNGSSGASFVLPGDVTGDGSPDLLASQDATRWYAVAGPITASLRVEDAAVAELFSARNLQLVLVPLGDTDGDGRGELLVQRGVEGLVRVDTPLAASVDVDALQLVVDYAGLDTYGRFTIPTVVGGGAVWVGGYVSPLEAEGFLFAPPWTGTRALGAADLHVFGAITPVEDVDAEEVYDTIVTTQVEVLGDINGNGTPDIGLSKPAMLIDLGLRGELAVSDTEGEAIARPSYEIYTAVGDVTGDGQADLVTGGPDDTACVVAGPIDAKTPGFATLATEADCAVVVRDATDGKITVSNVIRLGDVTSDGIDDWIAVATERVDEDGRLVPGGLSGLVDVHTVTAAVYAAPVVTTRNVGGGAVSELDGQPGMELILQHPQEHWDEQGNGLAADDPLATEWWEIHTAVAR